MAPPPTPFTMARLPFSSPLSSLPPSSPSPPTKDAEDAEDKDAEEAEDEDAEDAEDDDWEDEDTSVDDEESRESECSGIAGDNDESEASEDSILGRSYKHNRTEPHRRRPRVRLGSGFEHLTSVEQGYMHRIETILQEAKWDVGRFLTAYIRNGERKVRVKALNRAFQRVPLLRQFVSHSLDGSSLMKATAKRVRSEWPAVMRDRFFGKEASTQSVEELDPRVAFAVLKKQAPLWVELLQLLLQPRRDRSQRRTGKSDVPEAVMQRSISITTIGLGMFARNASNGFRHKLGCYLHQSGLAKRPIDTLAGFGLTPTYKYINKALNRMVERSEVGSFMTFYIGGSS